MPNPELTDEQRRVIASLCECALSPLSQEDEDKLVEEFKVKLSTEDRSVHETEREIRNYARRDYTDANSVSSIENAMRSNVTPEKFGELSFLLNILASRPGALFFCGGLTPFPDLPLEERRQVFEQWATSSFAMKRNVHGVFKTLTLRGFVADLPEDDPIRRNINWDLVGYPGPDPQIDSERFCSQEAQKNMYDFSPHILTVSDLQTQSFEFDAVVIGSSCGGGLVSSHLADAGFRVLVIEKGKYYRFSDLTLLEADSKKMFENEGALAAVDGSVHFLSGSCLGGGSTINWTCCLRPPAPVRSEWANQYGLKHVLSPSFNESIDEVSERLNIHTNHSLKDSAQNQILVKGCQKAGLPCSRAPQNVAGDHQCGWCGMGCRYAEKQGTMVTYLRNAAERGAKIMVETKGLRIFHKNGEVTGVEIQDLVTGKRTIVRTKLAVSSCGALNTPILLKRSGLTHPMVGQNLRVHPVSVAEGVFSERVNPWEGPILTQVGGSQKRRSDGSDYGAVLETPTAHPSLSMAYLPSSNQFESKRAYLNFPFRSNVIVIARDTGSGSVAENSRGSPEITYSVNSHDVQSLRSGLEDACVVLIEAGAKEVSIKAHSTPPLIVPSDYTDSRSLVRKWLEKLEGDGAFLPNRLGVFTAHQMGTARMGGSYLKGPISPSGESWEIRGLYVADTSLFPTPSGVNPMLTCYALCDGVAKNIVKDLQSRSKKSDLQAKL